MTAALILLFVIIAVGSCLQRVSGMGLGLIAGPVLSVVLGPVEGILVVNALAVINAVATTVTVHQNVDWRKFALISSVLVFGAVPGALLVREVSPSLLQVLVGALLLIALALVTFGKNRVPEASGRVPAVSAGVVGGFMNTLAGIAGPALTVYARASRWPQQTYAATLQPIFVVAGSLSFGIKLVTGAGSLAAANWLIWPVGVAAMVVGIGAGIVFSRRISRTAAWRLALGLATAGGVTVLVRGLVSLS